MTSFWTPTGFLFLNKKIYFCPHIAEFANIAEFLSQKTFGDIAPPHVWNFINDRANAKPSVHFVVFIFM